MPTKKSEDYKISFSFLAYHYCDTTKSIRNCFASKAKRFFFKPFGKLPSKTFLRPLHGRGHCRLVSLPAQIQFGSAVDTASAVAAFNQHLAPSILQSDSQARLPFQVLHDQIPLQGRNRKSPKYQPVRQSHDR